MNIPAPSPCLLAGVVADDLSYFSITFRCLVCFLIVIREPTFTRSERQGGLRPKTEGGTHQTRPISLGEESDCGRQSDS